MVVRKVASFSKPPFRSTMSADNNDRLHLLSLCTVSDVECCDSSFTLLRRATALNDPAAIDEHKVCQWPTVAYSCDFCGTWPTYIAQCDVCARWVGLSDCQCAVERFRREECLFGQVIVQKEAAIGAAPVALCRWCHCVTPDGIVDLTIKAPASAGLSRGLLSRIVFVLEPKINANSQWNFNVAHWMAQSLLSKTGVGTTLVYGIPCGEGEQAWCDALAIVQQFALRPRHFLPPNCRLLSDEHANKPLPRISLVIATHSVEHNGKVYWELGSPDTVRSPEWWCNALLQNAFSKRMEHQLRIDEWHPLVCNLFAPNCDASSHFQVLSDNCNVAVMAPNGNVLPFEQAHFVASHIVSRLYGREDALVCPVRRIQPNAATLIMRPRSFVTKVASYHPTQLARVVQNLSCPRKDLFLLRAALRQRRKRKRSVDNHRFGEGESFECIIAQLCERSPFQQKLDICRSEKLHRAQFTLCYAKWFEKARILRRLLALPEVDSLDVIFNGVFDWFHKNNIKEPEASNVRVTLEFYKKLLHPGIICDEVDTEGPPKCLESAISSMLVDFQHDYVRVKLDLDLFDIALPSLREHWCEMWNVQQHQMAIASGKDEHNQLMNSFLPEFVTRARVCALERLFDSGRIAEISYLRAIKFYTVLRQEGAAGIYSSMTKVHFEVIICAVIKCGDIAALSTLLDYLYSKKGQKPAAKAVQVWFLSFPDPSEDFSKWPENVLQMADALAPHVAHVHFGKVTLAQHVAQIRKDRNPYEFACIAFGNSGLATHERLTVLKDVVREFPDDCRIVDEFFAKAFKIDSNVVIEERHGQLVTLLMFKTNDRHGLEKLLYLWPNVNRSLHLLVGEIFTTCLPVLSLPWSSETREMAKFIVQFMEEGVLKQSCNHLLSLHEQ